MIAPAKELDCTCDYYLLFINDVDMVEHIVPCKVAPNVEEVNEIFQEILSQVDPSKCRIVTYYLMPNKQFFEIFGVPKNFNITVQ